MAAMPAPAAGLAVLVLFAAALPALSADDLNTDAQALQALRSAVGRSALPSWNSTTPTCQWQGVTCESGRVVELRLPGAGLMGNLPSGVLGNLSALRTLSLRYNALTGPIPDDLSRLSELRAIYFQHNSFSGEVPASLFELKNLVRLDIAGNKFSGKISPDFNKLIRLGTLYMDGNSFTGEIPKLQLPALEQFNVSYNQLNGSIPNTLRKMPKDSFLGNTGLCGGPLGLCPGESAPTAAGSPESQPGAGGAADVGGGKKKKLSGGAIDGCRAKGTERLSISRWRRQPQRLCGGHGSSCRRRRRRYGGSEDRRVDRVQEAHLLRPHGGGPAVRPRGPAARFSGGAGEGRVRDGVQGGDGERVRRGGETAQGRGPPGA
uniref:Leucine-rich repeat-containing N-terminal plant-type domain-containing protein n=1 Tax=Zea mays TaxID=4577 RepID=A0A804RBE6_MAIZE